jgi:hypothetical protein
VQCQRQAKLCRARLQKCRVSYRNQLAVGRQALGLLNQLNQQLRTYAGGFAGSDSQLHWHDQ